MKRKLKTAGAETAFPIDSGEARRGTRGEIPKSSEERLSNIAHKLSAIKAYNFVTMSDYDQSQWYQLYARAMVELEHALMAGRIMDARSKILTRLELLRDMPGLHQPER